MITMTIRGFFSTSNENHKAQTMSDAYHRFLGISTKIFGKEIDVIKTETATRTIFEKGIVDEQVVGNDLVLTAKTMKAGSN